MEEEFQKVGQRIRLMRLKHGMPQYEFARFVGMKQTTISCIENGSAHPTLRLLFKARRIFGCRMEDFFEDEIEPESKINVDEIIEAMRLVKKMKSEGVGETREKK